jgi:hypothetical protein
MGLLAVATVTLERKLQPQKPNMPNVCTRFEKVMACLVLDHRTPRACYVVAVPNLAVKTAVEGFLHEKHL